MTNQITEINEIRRLAGIPLKADPGNNVSNVNTGNGGYSITGISTPNNISISPASNINNINIPIPPTYVLSPSSGTATWGIISTSETTTPIKLDAPPIDNLIFSSNTFETIKKLPSVLATSSYIIQFTSTVIPKNILDELTNCVDSYAIDFMKKTLRLKIRINETLDVNSLIKNLVKDGFDSINLSVLKNNGTIAYTQLFEYVFVDSITTIHDLYSPQSLLMYQFELHYDNFI